MKPRKNKVMDMGLYHPGDHSHVKSSTKPAPAINQASRNQAAGMQPGRDSLISTSAYQSGDYDADIKRDSPDRKYR